MTTIFRPRHRGTTLVAGLLSAALVLSGCGGDPGDENVPDGSGTGTEPTENQPSESEPTENEPAENEPDGGAQTRIFAADNGDIEIPVAPQRVVAIGNAVMPVVNLGVEPVGVSVQAVNTSVRWFTPDERAAYDAAAPVSQGSDVDFEAIAGLEPDLILIVVPAPVWEGSYGENEDRFQSIAPSVFIANDALRWKEHLGRVADALGRQDAVDQHKAAYDQTVDEINEEFGGIIESTTFALATRYPQTEEGSFAIEHSGYWCAAYATEAGLDFPESPDGNPSTTLSMERLGDLAEVDVIVYPLDPDGTPRAEFAPVAESNAWNALPAVAAGRAFGVVCPSGQNYTNGIRNLESFRQALTALAEAG